MDVKTLENHLIAISKIHKMMEKLGDAYIKEHALPDYSYTETEIDEDGDMSICIKFRSACSCCPDDHHKRIALTPRDLVYPSIFINKLKLKNKGDAKK